MNVPDELRYSADHEWIQRDGDVLRIGITDYAQDALGDVVFVELPEVGATVATTKSVSDIFAPVAGTVTEVNSSLDDEPELVNSDPYGAGWICAITPGDAGEYDGLLDAAAYTALTNED
jgi:glycine cleavage system H protein